MPQLEFFASIQNLALSVYMMSLTSQILNYYQGQFLFGKPSTHGAIFEEAGYWL
jgi:hypothetical protein